MDRETTILIIAQNGLKTAATLMSAKAARAEKQAEKASDPAVATKLKKSAAKFKKLASVLTASDEGITAYLKEREEA